MQAPSFGTFRLLVPILVLVGLCPPVHGDDPFAGATTLIMKGDPAGALEVYESFLTSHDGDRLAPVAALAIGNLQANALEDRSAAVAAFERVLTRYPKSTWAPEAARRKGECLEAEGRLQPAGEAYQQALALTGRLGEEGPAAGWISDVSLQAANCFYQMGDRAQVIQTYEQVLSNALPPDAVATTLYRLGDCYETGGDAEKAAARYARILEEYPLTPEFTQTLGKRELITEHRPLDWAAYEAFGQAAQSIRQRAYAEALDHCDEVTRQTNSPILLLGTEYYRIASQAMVAGDYTKGARELQGLLRRLPAGQSRTRIAGTCDRFERVAALEAAAKRNPEDAAALVRLGRAYTQFGSNEAAVETLQRALARDPENAEIHLNLGYAHAGLGATEEANRAFDAYLVANPNDTAALNQIGYTFLQRGMPAMALPFFERYAAIAPEDPNAHDSYGEGLLEAGRLEDSIREYERALELDPNFTNSLFMLGRVHRQAGETEKALQAFRAFLEISPTGVQAEQAQAAIADMTQ